MGAGIYSLTTPLRVRTAEDRRALQPVHGRVDDYLDRCERAIGATWPQRGVDAGMKMVIRAGQGSVQVSDDEVNTGAVYDPATNTWIATSTGANARRHAAPTPQSGPARR